MKIRVKRPNPDGMDAVYEAYQQLKRIYAAGERVVEEFDDGEYYAEWLILPGSQEPVLTDDVNELSALEHWLTEEFAKRIAKADASRKLEEPES